MRSSACSQHTPRIPQGPRKGVIVASMSRLLTLVFLSMSLLATTAFGCGGKNKPAESTADPVATTESDAQPTESPEAKFARQKSDTVDKMCQRLVDCSLEDAEKQAPPEELAELNANREGITRAAIADCNKQFAGPMSPRQVITVRECLGQPTECSDFSACLDKLSAPTAPAE